MFDYACLGFPPLLHSLGRLGSPLLIRGSGWLDLLSFVFDLLQSGLLMSMHSPGQFDFLLFVFGATRGTALLTVDVCEMDPMLFPHSLG